MRGQNTIIRMRLSRWKPAMVWVFVLNGAAPRRPMLDAENAVQLGGLPEVHVGVDETPGALDFRFLTGLTVLLQGDDVDRLRQVYARLQDFEPARIVASSGDFVHDTGANNE